MTRHRTTLSLRSALVGAALLAAQVGLASSLAPEAQTDGKISGFNGVVYVQVADIVASCKRATELGGAVVPGFPFNLPEEVGAIAVLTDPSGHPLGMYSRTPLAPARSSAK